jgi:hypothetical protein
MNAADAVTAFTAFFTTPNGGLILAAAAIALLFGFAFATESHAHKARVEKRAARKH